MRLSASFLLATLPLCAIAIPRPYLSAAQAAQLALLAEEQPWHLTNIVAFKAPANTTELSKFSFQLQDRNEGLELNTTCERTYADGLEPYSPEPTYFPCADPKVAFRFDQSGRIDIRRSWTITDETSDEIGRRVACFGNWQTVLHESPETIPGGYKRTQGCLDVYCSQVSG